MLLTSLVLTVFHPHTLILNGYVIYISVLTRDHRSVGMR